jgi:hypothetical protein
MQRCWLKGSQGDALHVELCSAGFNIRWLALGRHALLTQSSSATARFKNPTRVPVAAH